MSSIYVKTQYMSESAYGEIQTNTLYAQHDGISDFVTFFDDSGDPILTVPDTMGNNILDAINKLMSPFSNEASRKYLDDIEPMDEVDRIKILDRRSSGK